MAYVTFLTLSGSGLVSTATGGASGAPFAASSIIALKGIAGTTALNADVYVGASSTSPPALKIATLKAIGNGVDFMFFDPDGIGVNPNVDQATVVFNDTDTAHAVYIYWK